MSRLARLKGLLEALPDLVFTLDREGRFLSYHCPPGHVLTVPPEKFLGIRYRECLPSEAVAPIDAAWSQLMSTGDPQACSYEMPLADGRRRYYEARLVLTEDREILLIAQNVTDRVLLENARRESEHRFRQIVENTQDGVTMIDTKGRMLFVNERMARMLGYSSQELLTMTAMDVVHPEHAALMEQKLANRRAGVPEKYDVKFRRKDGSLIWLLTSGSPIYDETGAVLGAIGVHLDIGERKRNEELIAKQQSEIISSSKMSALGVMAGGIAHEINNPLAIIHGRASQLRYMVSRGKFEPEAVAFCASRIEETALRISRIVKALQSFSRDAENDPFQSSTIQAILSDSLELCQERFRHHGIALEVDPVVEGLEVSCRPGQVSQIILNLLNNSFDAIESLPSRWVRLSVREADDEVEVSVTDSGSGIPAEMQERILQPFFTTKDVGKGTGLGLSVSKGLAEGHGGRLYLDTCSPNTRFVLCLPRRPAAATKKADTLSSFSFSG